MTAHCRYCHRPLKDPESVARGVGPVCAELSGRMLSLFEQPRRLRDVLAEDYGTTLEAIADAEMPSLESLLARELLRMLPTTDRWSGDFRKSATGCAEFERRGIRAEDVLE